ncbi:IclR family transcriptional regulator [Daeguia caeni]|uniref:IclR family transcriptional regulator n=1 Tax=Daeguia caeni TaxID=439612 RepID=A0ABV9H9N0_9HYPH
MQSNKVNVVRKEQNVKGVESVDRALTILDAMARKRAAMTLHELSLATNFYKSTILRLITSLEKFGYIRKREDGRYVLGPACAALAGAQSAAFDLAGLMRATIERLAETTGETVSFYIRDGNERVCAQRRNSTHSIRHHVEEGQRMPLEKRGSASQVLLAFSGDDGPGMERVRQEGYAISLGERDPDAAGIAVPIFDAKDQLLGALTVSGLRSRFTFEVVDRVRDELVAARKELERNLGRSVE